MNRILHIGVSAADAVYKATSARETDGHELSQHCSEEYEGRRQNEGGRGNCGRPCHNLGERHEGPGSEPVSHRRLLVVLGATKGLQRVVVPPHVGYLLPADPAPLAFALAGHVVAAGDLFREDPARRTRVGVQLGQRLPLPLDHGPLILSAGGGPHWMRVAVVEAELITAEDACHLREDGGVLPLLWVSRLWFAELVARGARPQVAVLAHPLKSLKLVNHALAHPHLHLRITHLGIAAILAHARAPEIGDVPLLDA
mmetsp:Transcript_9025/g.27443  ORF Transcript_9025/g.27443 Transcript_9025/m.27443 type:complete len:256 (-) Transcript_9025:707-1474(-)